jgi:twinkle protein
MLRHHLSYHRKRGLLSCHRQSTASTCTAWLLQDKDTSSEQTTNSQTRSLDTASSCVPCGVDHDHGLMLGISTPASDQLPWHMPSRHWHTVKVQPRGLRSNARCSGIQSSLVYDFCHRRFAEQQSSLSLSERCKKFSTSSSVYGGYDKSSGGYGNGGGSAFVSKHNTSLKITSAEVIKHLRHHNFPVQQGQDLKVTPGHVIMRECPFCDKHTRDDPSNLFKLFVQIGGGAFFCHRCGCKGSWYDFKRRTAGFASVDISSPYEQMSRQQREPSSSGTSSSYNNNSRSAKNYDMESTTHKIPKLPSRRIVATYSSNLLDRTTEPNAVLQYLLKKRGLNKSTLRKYGVGMAKYRFPNPRASGGSTKSHGAYTELDCITFPWIVRLSELNEQEKMKGGHAVSMSDLFPNESTMMSHQAQDDNNFGDTTEAASASAPQQQSDEGQQWLARRVKVRALHSKGFQKLDPAGGGWGFFGWHTIPENATEIVLTEGEFDAMAVHQATKRPAISLPSGCRNLPVDLLPMLERFDKIYLWMDNDAPGQQGAADFAKKLGMKRCYVVRSIEASSINDGDDDDGGYYAKDANEALLRGHNLEDYIEQASLVPHEGLLDFSSLRTQVLHEICNPHQYSGVKIKSLPEFTKIIKGYRRGELTILTGPTGSGKTTFLGQLSLDFAEQGVNTLWGSFEIKNTRLLHKLLQQFAQGPLPSLSDLRAGGPRHKRAMEALNSLADRFETLPLHFMTFFGTTDVDDILDAMEYATYIHDVEHIILDNLQFMLSREAGRKGGGYFDKFEVQDIAVEKFRKFATDKNVHITLVVHPRKEDETTPLTMSSVYGSAKATQEADTVLILQHKVDSNQKYIQVKKNRFDGTLGSVPLHFHRSSGRYGEETEREAEGRTLNKIEVSRPPSNELPPASPSTAGSVMDDVMESFGQEKS